MSGITGCCFTQNEYRTHFRCFCTYDSLMTTFDADQCDQRAQHSLTSLACMRITQGQNRQGLVAALAACSGGLATGFGAGEGCSQ